MKRCPKQTRQRKKGTDGKAKGFQMWFPANIASQLNLPVSISKSLVSVYLVLKQGCECK